MAFNSWSIRRPNKARVVSEQTLDWMNLPWEAFHNSCLVEQNDALEVARMQNLEKYKAFLDSKQVEQDLLHPEGGGTEQNLSEEYPFRDITPQMILKIKHQAVEKVADDFLVEYRFKQFGVQYLNQIIKHLSTFKLTTEDGNDYDPKLVHLGKEKLISPVAFYRQVFNNPQMLGVYKFLMLDSRSKFLEKQYTAPGRSYCALVPLILMAFKLHHMVPYSHWNPSTLQGLVNGKLYEAMMYTADIDPASLAEALPTEGQILEAREIGLTIKSGKDIGKMRSSLYTHKLYGQTPISDLPELLQVMLAQIWCAHPNNRTKYMILDCTNWDRVPPPLIKTEVFSVASDDFYTKDVPAVNDLPWL